MASSLMNVEDALCIVLKQCSPLEVEILPLSPNLVGRIVAETIAAESPFPPFPASIMDGYAVCGVCEPGIYKITDKVFAGKASSQVLQVGEVAYITTGAVVPAGATGVVKVEETEKIDELHVKINVKVENNVNIRAIGSDIVVGETIVEKGIALGPAQLGLLATIGCLRVPCYRKPIIGVLSTGDEVVDYTESVLNDGQIRDSNRLTLLSTLQSDGFVVKDYGIGSDSRELLKSLLLRMAEECDVVVSSGGVSMGDADHVKPILGEIGSIHFQQLNLKPGKPTVFATYLSSSSSKCTYFFGLPGNPVSCIVTKSLFITPALKRLQGLSSHACMHSQVTVLVQGESIRLDPERVEYHRVNISYGTNGTNGTNGVNGVNTGTCLVASSTGNQRSSRLLSMQCANGLLVLPRGPGVVSAGTVLQALLLHPLDILPPPQYSVHPLAAAVDTPLPLQPSTKPDVSKSESTVASIESIDWKVIRTGVLTISDRASKGIYDDNSGPEIHKMLSKMNDEEGFPLRMVVTQTSVVPDDPLAIRKVIEDWTDPNTSSQVDMLFTTGGTGFGPRDYTPEVLLPLLHRQAPGIAQVLLNEGLKHTPLAVLSRPVVGTRHKTFIVTLPGSTKAIRENIVSLTKLLPRIFELLKTGDCQHVLVSSSTNTTKYASMCECCK